METKVEQLDSINYKVSATLTKEDINKAFEQVAKEASKTVQVDGFRKGKVPVAVVKKLFKDKLLQDAKSQTIQDALKNAYKEADLNPGEFLGEPLFDKFDESDEKIELSLIVSKKPEFELGDYSDIVPEYEKPTASEEEIEKELQEIAKEYAKPKKLQEERPLQEGDVAVFDFKGFVDGKEFEGGSATNYELKIGSKQFIEGFEEQMIGMKAGEKKRIKVKFPQNYHAKNLAGKEAEFDITLHEIKEFYTPNIDDELAKLALGKADATLEELKNYAKKIIEDNKARKLYEEELKPQILENIVKKYNFDLPKNIVEQEIDNLASQKAQEMSEEELKEIREKKEKLEELRKSVQKDAEDSVRATFVVDALAKAENIEVSDGEVSQVIYYEALFSGQDPQKLLEYYQKNNLIPVIKMGIVEDKLFTKLLKLYENNEESSNESETKEEAKKEE